MIFWEESESGFQRLVWAIRSPKVFAMVEKFPLARDWATILAFLFGAAVVVPSLLALVFSVLAVAGLLI